MNKQIKIFDARKLSTGAQEALRLRAFRAGIEEEETRTKTAELFGVSPKSANIWGKAYKEQVPDGLNPQPQGVPPRPGLSEERAQTLVTLITENTPNQLPLPFALWTREAVRKLLSRHFDGHVSERTPGRYLRKWGLSSQKPTRRAYGQASKAVEQWLQETYPGIRRQAREEQAEIHWGDQMGIRNNHQTGTSYGRKGPTPVVPGRGKRFRINMISTITNRGQLAFYFLHQRFTKDVIIEFLEQLLRHAKRKGVLIVDRHPVHQFKKVRLWVRQYADRIRLPFLPGHGPELNPDELLNQDVKMNPASRERADNEEELNDNPRSYLRSTQSQPEILRSYFRHPTVAYAA